ncbi:gas vesicle protein GvpJ [Actinacidiphila acidipaludis]|uniref:Gas vesicle protein A n=1 Tax=Actinacidiphila acidipaludis TaxID=2873382 RepID=A0ABS7PYZ1_9ACTN|nr:gas vesicle protein GvpJ [Streptomyces acidipaludis]MBY8876112.1 gas vesicle structural protein GvpA [Streptomyces acidipaludis]
MTVITDGVVCAPRAGTLYDVLDLILDRGIVIDAFVRVSLVGIEILKIDARIVVASVDTYLRFAEACNRLDLEHDASSRTVPELFGGGGGAATSIGKAGAKKAARSVGDKVKEVVGGGSDDDDDSDDEGERAPKRRAASRTGSGSRARSRRRDEED